MAQKPKLSILSNSDLRNIFTGRERLCCNMIHVNCRWVVRTQQVTWRSSVQLAYNTLLGIEPWWNDDDRGKPKYSETNLSQCHFVHHKSHRDWPGSEPSLLCERPATTRLSHVTVNTGSNVTQRRTAWDCVIRVRDLHCFIRHCLQIVRQLSIIRGNGHG
jgi:hypothetical protein